jgi:uncharacterized repeat protein (TIGR01451 family)
MVRFSFWRRLARIVACVLLILTSLPLAIRPKTAFAQQEAISINPTQGPPGTNVTVTGTGWQPGWTVPIGTDLSPTPLVTAIADSSGTFSISITIPSSAPAGQLRIWAVIGNGGSADAWFTVTTNAPTVTVQKVWTADGNNTAKTVFAPGDAIHYMVQVNSTDNTTVTATVGFGATTTLGPTTIYYWSGPASVVPGTSAFYSPSTIPSTAPAAQYTLIVVVNYNGMGTQGKSTFTVIGNSTPIPTTPPTVIPTQPPTPSLTKVDLAVIESVAWKSAASGETFLYEIIVSNNGPADATGVILTVRLPVQLWPIVGNILSSQGNCLLPPSDEDPITVTCQMGNLSAHASVTVFFTVGVSTSSSVHPGMITSTATVKGDQADPNPKNNISPLTTEITKPSELTADELNVFLALARQCGEILTDLPFIEKVNNLIDKLEGHQMSPQEALNGLIQDTLDLLARMLKSELVKVLTKLFTIPACISYGREIFSIGP